MALRPTKMAPEEIILQLAEAAKTEEKALAAIMALLAHVNEYKIADLVDALIETGALDPNVKLS